MTKSIKKPLSLLLTLTLVFSLASGLASPARAATSHTQITISDDGPITKTIVDAALVDAGLISPLPSDTYEIAFTGTPTSIENDAFKGLAGLTGISIPSSILSIGDSAFEGCTGLTLIDIPGTVASIGNRAFYGCTGLTNVYIRLGVKTIGDSAFSGCTGLTSITFPVSVETIGDSAFANCYGLTNVVFAGNDPANNSDLTSIGNSAFSGCRWLSAVEFLGSVPTTFNTNAFAYCAVNLTLYCPSANEVGWSSIAGTLHVADIATKPADGECLITSFSVNGIPGVIDNVSNIIFAIVPNGTVLTALTPDIQHNGDTISPDTAQDFNTPRVYEVSDNGTVRRYAVYVMETGSVDLRVNSAAPSGSYVSISTNKLVISFYVANLNYVAKYDVTIDNGATLSNPVWSGTGNDRTLTYDLGSLSANTTYNVLVRALYGRTGNEVVSPFAHSHSFSTNSDPGGTPSTVTCAVTYDANGGTGSHKVSNLTSGVTHTVLTLDGTGISRDGYSFTGWNTKADGSGTAYAPGDGLAISGDVTLYAQWKQSPKLDTENHFAYIVGYPDGSVQPEGNITRAETATIFFRLLTQEYRAAVWSTGNSFSDVSADNWYNNAISTLSNAGILDGYSDGSFNPNGSITRAEFATIAVRFADTSGVSTAGISFSDISGHWAERNIKLAAALGYAEGYSDGSFRPDEYITRAEVMTLLNRVLNRHVNSEADMLADMVTWPDNTSGKWYYFDVQEATNSHYYERKADGVNETWTEMRVVPDWRALEKPGAKPSDVSY